MIKLIQAKDLSFEVTMRCHHHSVQWFKLPLNMSEVHLSKIDNAPIFVFTCKVVKCCKSSAVLQGSLGDNNSGLLTQLGSRVKVPLPGSGYFKNKHSFNASFFHQLPLKLSNRSAAP